MEKRSDGAESRKAALQAALHKIEEGVLKSLRDDLLVSRYVAKRNAGLESQQVKINAVSMIKIPADFTDAHKLADILKKNIFFLRVKRIGRVLKAKSK